MQEQNNKKKLFSSNETILLVIMSLLIGLFIGSLFFSHNKVDIKNNTSDKYLNEFIKNYNYIVDNYYQSINKEELLNGAISGMMESLNDPYSTYFDETDADNFSITLDGSYKGVGIQFVKDEDSGYMLVTSVFKNSPAFEAGIQAGDYILSIDESLSKDLTANDFSLIIKKGSKDSYNLRILRDKKEFEITLKKQTVTLTSVTSEYYEKNNKKIGYIYIGIFANNTYSQFKDSLNELELKKIDYLVIDVRGNTGGHLIAVDGILDLLLNSSQILYGFEQNGKTTFTYGTGNENKSYKIILLGDEVSASASEVLISSLKENLGSIFIGKKTYGKGTVQELVTLSDGTQYKITVKKWLTPKGNWINDTKGILPDIDVSLDEKYYNTYEEDDDSQLQAVFKYIEQN